MIMFLIPPIMLWLTGLFKMRQMSVIKYNLGEWDDQRRRDVGSEGSWSCLTEPGSSKGQSCQIMQWQKQWNHDKYWNTAALKHNMALNSKADSTFLRLCQCRWMDFFISKGLYWNFLLPSTFSTSSLSERSLQKMQIYAVGVIKMHPAKKKENIQWALMRCIIILKLPFVVCVSSGLGVMKWLWHFISDSCEDDKGIVCRWFGFITGTSEQFFIWCSLRLTATLFCRSSAIKWTQNLFLKDLCHIKPHICHLYLFCLFIAGFIISDQFLPAKHHAVYPSIYCCLSWIGSQGHQVKQSSPGSFCPVTVQLLPRDPNTSPYEINNPSSVFWV